MFDFNKFLSITVKDVRVMFNDRSALMIMILTPLVLTLVMGAAFSGFNGGDSGAPIQDIPVALVNKDKGSSFGNFGDYFNQILVRDENGGTPTALQKLLYVKPMGEDEAIQQVKAGKLTAAVIIPEDFSQQLGPATGTSSAQAKIVVYKDVGQQIGSMIVTSVIQSISNNIAAGNIAVAAAGKVNPLLLVQAEAIAKEVSQKFSSAAPITVVDQNVAGQATGNSFNLLGYFAPAMAVFFLTFTAAAGASTMIEERDNWTLQRLIVSPTSRMTILAGKLGGIYISGILQLTILMVATALIGPLVGSKTSVWGSNIPGLAVLTLATVAAATGLGILIAAIAKTASQADTYSRAVLILMGIAGGTFFQISGMGSTFDLVTKLTLNHWAINGFSLLSQGKDLVTVLPNIAALFGMFVLFFALGVRQFARRLDS